MNALIDDVKEAPKNHSAPEKSAPRPRRSIPRIHPALRADLSALPSALPPAPAGDLDDLVEPPSPPARPVAPAPKAAAAPRPAAQQQAVAIERSVMPSVLASALGMDKYFDASGYRAFLDKVRADAGNPTDPVEVMLLEQLVLAHLRSAQLQAQASAAEGIEAVKIYNSAAARLLGEFRLTALSLAAYRRSRSGGSQGGEVSAGAPTSARGRHPDADSKLVSKG